MKLGLRSKLVRSFGLILLVLAAVEAMNIYTSKTIAKQVEHTAQMDIKAANLLADLSQKAGLVHADTLLHLSASSPEDMERYESEIAQCESEIDALLDTLQDTCQTQAELTKLTEFRYAWDRYASIRDEQVLPASRTDHKQEALVLIAANDAATAAQTAFAKLAELQEASITATDQRLALANQVCNRSQALLLFIVPLAAIIALIFIAYQGSQIVSGLKLVSDTAQLIAGGDLDWNVALHTGDEVEALADSLNAIARNMKKMLAAQQETEKQLRYQANRHKRVADTLASEEERLDTVLRSIDQGIIVTDTAGKVVLLNKAAAELTGWDQDEAVGQPLDKVFHIIDEKTHQRCDNPAEMILTTGAPVSHDDAVILLTRDGNERFITDNGLPLHDKDGTTIGALLAFRDISAQKRTKEELLRVSKLAALGALSSDLAHDLNNALTAVLGYIGLAQMLADSNDELSQSLRQAEDAVLRLNDLTRQISALSQGGKPVMHQGSVAEVLKTVSRLALRDSPSHCEFYIAADLWPIEMDESQISTAINHLLVNADQAMPEGGIIKVFAENTTVTAAQGLPLQPGKYVKISVEDQGNGIPLAQIDKLFDLQSALQQDKGTLGLVTAYSIVKKHNGHITIESKPGVGTTFHIYLPAFHREVQVSEEEEEKATASRGKILVMDNEEVVRDVASRMLSYMGYEVEVARDGAEAVILYKEAQEAGKPFDVVILDLTIVDGMGAKKAIKELSKIDSNVKAIVSTAYVNDPITSNFRQHGFKAFAIKPYELPKLITIVDRLIAGVAE